MKEIPYRECCGDDLAYHSGHCSPHHSPPAPKNENRVQNNVGGSSGQGGRHGKAGISVGPDDRIHGLAKHIKGNAQTDIEEILLRILKSLLIDRAAEQRDDLVLQQQIHRCQHQTSGHTHDHSIPHTAFGRGLVPLTQADAHKGAAAVSDHHGNGQRHHRQRKNHRVRSIAIGPQIAGIGDENLVDDVVQCAYQQRNDARNRVPSHQTAHRFGAQKLTVLFHKTFPSSSQKARSPLSLDLRHRLRAGSVYFSPDSFPPGWHCTAG